MTGALRIHRIEALRPGPRLLVLGAVHGNETCGTVAIRRVLGEIDAGVLAIERGTLTLLPVTNPLAHALRRREGDRNLNRSMRPSTIPVDHEDRVANRLCALLRSHDVLLDLHSFHTPGDPFVMVGPHDNDGPLEPFARSADERRFAAHLGPVRVVEGWLDAWSRGVRRRAERDGVHEDTHRGVGTTEYHRAHGGYGVTLECGQHDDPAAPEVAYRAIRQAIALLGLAPLPLSPPAPAHEVLRLVDVVDRLHPDDRFVAPWTSFAAVTAGQPIGQRHDGTIVTAPAAGRIVFPHPGAVPGHEWFYFARPVAGGLHGDGR